MKIIWTDFAIQNLTPIFDYHVENATKKVAHKIKNEIFKAVKQTSRFWTN
jgi:plasmid stabilization system protein ParE